VHCEIRAGVGINLTWCDIYQTKQLLTASSKEARHIVFSGNTQLATAGKTVMTVTGTKDGRLDLVSIEF
jgi:hypothetical protein